MEIGRPIIHCGNNIERLDLNSKKIWKCPASASGATKVTKLNRHELSSQHLCLKTKCTPRDILCKSKFLTDILVTISLIQIQQISYSNTVILITSHMYETLHRVSLVPNLRHLNNQHRLVVKDLVKDVVKRAVSRKG